MTRTAIRHTIFALALTAFTSLTAHAQFDSQINTMMNNNLQMLPAQSKAKSESAEGLTLRQGSPEPRQFARMIVKKLDKVRKAR